jgi:nucleoside-diphosphate-sugar epimerase
MNDIHVIFGSGPLGRSVMNELVRRGERVRVVNRSGSLEPAPTPVEVIAADAYDLEQAVEVSRGAKVMYNCVAPAYSAIAWENQLPKLWGNVLEAAARHGARLVIGDNLYMYDQIGVAIREDAPYRSSTRKGRARIRAVGTMLEAHRQGRAMVSFARGSNFFGPFATDQSHLGSRVFPALLRGFPVQLVGNPDVSHTITYIEDFGRAMVKLSDHEHTFGRAWHVPNAPTKTRRELLEVAARIAGQPLRIQTMPRWMVQGLGLIVPALREVSEMMYQFEQPYIVDSSLFAQTFGNDHTPLETALERTLEWFAAGLPVSSATRRLT